MLNSPKLTISLAVIIGFLLLGLLTGGPIRMPGDNQGYQPTQPINYSHKLHAGDLGLDCFYCHTSVERGKHATVPTASTCMNCHRYVKKLDEQGNMSPEIAKLYDALALDDSGQPDPAKRPRQIEWVRLHDLPDFVRFNHAPHIKSGVACQECHGPIETMEKVSQHQDWFMGKCVNCHRDVNHNGVKGMEGKKVNARLDCSTCHY